MPTGASCVPHHCRGPCQCRNPLVHALIAGGLLTGAAVAGRRLTKAQSTVGADATVAAAVAPQAPVAPLPPGATPNYRAIVQQAARPWSASPSKGRRRWRAACPACRRAWRTTRSTSSSAASRLGAASRGGEVPVRGQGSGFIISADGLILTNAHVVRDMKDVTVKLSDRREFKTKVLGTDTVTDIAVLRIDARNLPTVRLGDAQQLQVGDPVLAIGSPFGFEQTATQGIVSAKGRSLPGDGAVPFIRPTLR